MALHFDQHFIGVNICNVVNTFVCSACLVIIDRDWEKKAAAAEKSNEIYKLVCDSIRTDIREPRAVHSFMACALELIQIYADRISKLFDMSLLVFVQPAIQSKQFQFVCADWPSNLMFSPVSLCLPISLYRSLPLSAQRNCSSFIRQLNCAA